MNALREKAKPSAHSSELSAPAPNILHLRHSLWSKAARDPLHKAEHWQMTRQLHKCGCSHAECLSSLLRAGTKPATVPLIPSNLLEILSNTLLMTVRSSLLQTADLHQQYNHSSNSVFFFFLIHFDLYDIKKLGLQSPTRNTPYNNFRVGGEKRTKPVTTIPVQCCGPQH